MKKLVLPFFCLFFLLVFSVPSSAVTAEEVIAMAEAGVSTDVILALIEATDSVFRLSPDDIVALEEAGVDDEIILAMIGTKDGETDVDTGEDVYLQLSEEQFKRLFLESDTGSLPEAQPSETARQPEYYYSPGSYFGQGYISHPDYSTSRCSTGLTETTYYYTYPGTYTYRQKIYRPSYYYGYGYPGYFIYDGTVYYPGSYNYYDPYPKYYKVHQPHYYRSYHRPSSHVRVKGHPDDDWYFSLGFGF